MEKNHLSNALHSPMSSFSKLSKTTAWENKATGKAVLIKKPLDPSDSCWLVGSRFVSWWLSSSLFHSVPFCFDSGSRIDRTLSIHQLDLVPRRSSSSSSSFPSFPPDRNIGFIRLIQHQSCRLIVINISIHVRPFPLVLLTRFLPPCWCCVRLTY